MKKEKLTNTIVHAVLTAAVVAAALPMPEAAFAQDLNASVASVQTGISHIPQIVAGAFYIGGAAMIGAGAMKLKAHSENPGNTPIGHGLGRVVAGSALLAIPAFGQWLNNSLNLGQGNLTEASFGTVQ